MREGYKNPGDEFYVHLTSFVYNEQMKYFIGIAIVKIYE